MVIPTYKLSGGPVL